MQNIRSNHMQMILTREGGMFENEAVKVVRYLEQDGQVTIGRLEQAFDRAKQMLA